MAALRSPILIIGTGRSGSSLLREMLAAHPAIAMLGEMDFTVQRLWDCFWTTSAAAELRSQHCLAVHDPSAHCPEGVADEAILTQVRADDLENPRRSPLRLFENGQALGPAHSLHARIRTEGDGRYSHWSLGHILLFSTSDNTSPSANGRTYTIRFQP